MSALHWLLSAGILAGFAALPVAGWVAGQAYCRWRQRRAAARAVARGRHPALRARAAVPAPAPTAPARPKDDLYLARLDAEFDGRQRRRMRRMARQIANRGGVL